MYRGCGCIERGDCMGGVGVWRGGLYKCCGCIEIGCIEGCGCVERGLYRGCGCIEWLYVGCGRQRCVFFFFLL